jgi:TldD protein
VRAAAFGRTFQGGDYADLFFEYRAGGGLSFEEGILRSASRGVSLGLGVRVQKGDATGYAYVEDMEFDAMKRAAETAARIADGGKTIDSRQARAARRADVME